MLSSQSTQNARVPGRSTRVWCCRDAEHADNSRVPARLDLFPGQVHLHAVAEFDDVPTGFVGQAREGLMGRRNEEMLRLRRALGSVHAALLVAVVQRQDASRRRTRSLNHCARSNRRARADPRPTSGGHGLNGGCDFMTASARCYAPNERRRLRSARFQCDTVALNVG